MAFTDGLTSTVGSPTKSSQYNNVADNTEWLRTQSDVQHDYDITTSTGKHKHTVPLADSTYDLGTGLLRYRIAYIDTLGDSGQALGVAATTLSFDTAATIDTSGNNILTLSSGSAHLDVTTGLLDVTGPITSSTVITANTGFMPDANDGAYLGQAGTAFSDLFLAEGGVINWDSGDATITQTGNTVYLEGATFGVGTVPLVPLDVRGSGGTILLGTTPYSLITNDVVASASGYLIGSGGAGATDKATLLLASENAVAADVGGSIGFGAKVTTADNTVYHLAGIVGNKENATSANTSGYLAFGTRATGDYIKERMRITSAGFVGIGIAVPASKLDLRDGTFSLSDADVAHGMTDIAATNTAGHLQPYDATSGGLLLYGLTDADQVGIGLAGVQGVASPTVPAVVLVGGKKNVATWQALAATEMVLQVRNYTTNLVTVLGAGQTLLGTSTASAFAAGPSLLIAQPLNQNDNALEFQSANVAHGVTDLATTSAYGDAQKVDATAGGLKIRGFTEGSYGINLLSLITTAVTTKTTGSYGALDFTAGLKTGTTGGAIGANGILASIRNWGTTAWLLDAEGDTWQTGGATLGGATPNVWQAAYTPLSIGGMGVITAPTTAAAGLGLFVGNNFYINAAGDYTKIIDDEASMFYQANGGFLWSTAPSGTGTAVFSTPMTLTNAGQLLVGHTASVAVGATEPILQAHSATGLQLGSYQWSADAVGPYFYFAKARSATKGTMTAVVDNDIIGRISAYGADGTDLANVGAEIIMRINGTPAANDIPGEIELATYDGAAQAGSLILDAAGNLFLGNTANPTISANGSGDPGFMWRESGTYRYQMVYSASGNYLYCTTTDSDGGGTDADVWRIPDGQLSIDANTTWDDNAFDWVCDDCGWHGDQQVAVCPKCGSLAVAWHDDVALMDQAIHGSLSTNREVLGKLERLGIVNTYGTLEQANPEVFVSLSRNPGFLMSGIVQTRRILEERLSAQDVEIALLRSELNALKEAA